jgi:hypothetical protein
METVMTNVEVSPENSTKVNPEAIKLAPDLEMAVDFLKLLCPNGPWVLTAIWPEPGRPTKTQTFTDINKARAFIAARNVDHNIYYTPNPVKTAMSSKPKKTDIAEAAFVHADLDPNSSESPAEAKQRYRSQLELETFELKPTCGVDSGNGVQTLWRLDQPFKPDPKLDPDCQLDPVERRSEAIMKMLGAEDCSTFNVDRVLRLPGTVNWPTPAKQKKGRVPCIAKLLWFDPERRFALDAFPLPVEEPIGSPADGAQHSREPVEYDIDTLPVSERIRNLIKGIDHPDHHYPTRSHRVIAVIDAMVAAGCLDDEIRAVMRGPIGDHIRDQNNPEKYLTKQIKDARKYTTDKHIEEMNKTYALVIVGDKSPILKTPAKGFQFLTTSAFELWHANRFIQQGNKRVTLAQYWLKHPQRRQYEGITFAPNRDVPGHYNVWKGFAVIPKQGDCSKFRAHLKDNVCGGKDALYDWVIGWFAHIFQRPADKVGTALVLRGEQGAGKTKVGEVIGSLLGEHFVLAPEPRYITGRFNSHLVTCLLLHADEGFWAGDHAAEGKLKDLITGHSHHIEFKGKEPIRVQNYVRLLVTGNQDWLVPAGFDERRFAVLDVGDAHKQDYPYFAAIDNEMDHGGRDALLHYLLNFDLSKVNLRAIPKTVALLEQKISSLNPEAGWLLDVLNRGELPWGCDEPGTCPTRCLIDDYITHASKRGARRRAIETKIGMFLSKYVPGLKRVEGMYRRGEQQTEGYVYEFPSLAECRANFAKLMNQTPLWNEREEWGETEPRMVIDDSDPVNWKWKQRG